MRCVSYKPPPPFDALIASIWYFEGTHLQHTTERIVPNGTMQLLVNLSEDVLRWSDHPDAGSERRVSGAALAGAFVRPIIIDTNQQEAITGVSFIAGGAAAFFSGRMDAFTNEHVALSDLPGCGSIRDELLAARRHGEQAVVAAWMRILRRLEKPRARPQLDAAVRLLQTGVSVQRTADAVSLSIRKLRQDFSTVVGLSPKVFARIHRLQRVVRSAAAHPGDLDWASLAVEQGYSDQAHMIHDFRSLTGVTPSKYRPRSTSGWNHSVVN